MGISDIQEIITFLVQLLHQVPEYKPATIFVLKQPVITLQVVAAITAFVFLMSCIYLYIRHLNISNLLDKSSKRILLLALILPSVIYFCLWSFISYMTILYHYLGVSLNAKIIVGSVSASLCLYIITLYKSVRKRIQRYKNNKELKASMRASYYYRK